MTLTFLQCNSTPHTARHVCSCHHHSNQRMLSELSSCHVLCPGLPNYARNHVILGFHPEDVRILPIQTPNYQRYDHKKCPIFHSPSRRIPASERTYDENMCSKCTHLHTSILKLICHKYSRINSDLEKQLSSSPATSSNSSSSSHGLPSSSSVKDSSSSSRQNPGTYYTVYYSVIPRLHASKHSGRVWEYDCIE